MQIKQIFITVTTTSNYYYYSFDNVLNNNGKKLLELQIAKTSWSP